MKQVENSIVRKGPSNYYIESIKEKGQVNIITEQKIPKRLTYSPNADLTKIIGRSKDIKSVICMLDESTKVVLVNGIGGIGKTTLAKAILDLQKDRYQHTAWIDIATNVQEAFVSNTQLADNLHLDFADLPKNESFIDLAFELVINRLRQLGGNNLLILDNAQNDIGQEKIINLIRLEENWNILVTSRQNLEGFQVYPLGLLSKQDAVRLFYLHYKLEKSDATLTILEAVGLHTLAIGLIAKTAQSKKWPLHEIVLLLQDKGLDVSKDANIKFGHSSRKKTKDIFQYVLAIFEMAGLSERERWIMKQFAVLPSIQIAYEKNSSDSILKLLQIQNEKDKDKLTIGINKVVEKGWLQWDEANDTFNMHNVIQEIARSKLAPNVNDCRDLIQEMFSRMSYQHVDFVSNNNLIVQYLTKYIAGDSADFAELLDEFASVTQRFSDFAESISLQGRALEMKKKVLPANDPKISDSYNSLALAHLNLGELEKALAFQLKDLEITLVNSKEENYELAITYNNLSLIYRKFMDFEKAIFYQTKANKIAEKINDADRDNLVFNNAGNLDYIQKNFKAALVLFKKSLEIRIKNGADALWVSEAHRNLSMAYIEVSDFEKAKTHLDEAFQIEKELVPEKASFAYIYLSYGLLYYEQRDLDKALLNYQKSREIFQLNFSSEHPDVVEVENWINKIMTELQDEKI